MVGWLTQVGRFKVEHVPCPHPSLTVSFAGVGRGVQHTTEGSLEGALAKFLKIDAPHFLLGIDARKRVRILQLIELGYAAAALEHPAGTPATNGIVRAQIELADHAQRHPWLPQPHPVVEALRALYGALHHVAGIPLVYIPNHSRSRGVFMAHAGWYGHGDVPDQPAGHWDPGDLQYASLFKAITPPPPHPVPKPKPIRPLSPTWRLVRRANGLVYVEPLDRPT